MLDIESAFQAVLDQDTESAVISEASDQTVPSGSYRFEVISKRVEEGSERSPWPGRFLVRVGCKAVTKEGVTKGNVFFDASPIVVRNDSGKLDGPSRLWANMCRAAGKTNNRDVLEWVGQYPMRAYVSRSYKSIDQFGVARYVTPKTELEERGLRDAGFEARNFVQNLGAYRDESGH